jgi:Tat protein secretion system quality control protein TatD with DNase activity
MFFKSHRTSNKLKVYNAVSLNRFSSMWVISHITGIHYAEVESLLSALESEGKIYQSVGGHPKRYSIVNEEVTEENFDIDEEYYRSREEAEDAWHIDVPEGVVIHN